MSQPDLIGVIESAYRTDVSEKEWLGGVAHAARGQLDAGFGVGAWTFDARDLTRIRVLDTALSGDDPRVFDLMHQCNGILETRARDLRAEVHRHGPCQTFSEVLHPLKLIGYELGLGVSTVSAALSSALRKLGVGSVADVIRLLMPRGDA